MIWVWIELGENDWAVLYGETTDDAGYNELLSIAQTIQLNTTFEEPFPPELPSSPVAKREAYAKKKMEEMQPILDARARRQERLASELRAAIYIVRNGPR